MISGPVFCVASAFLLIFPAIIDGFNPEKYLSTDKIIKRRRYPSEVHDVITEDGYILTMHRIPNGKGQSRNRRKALGPIPVYLQHGILSSSADWVIHENNKTLAFKLADRGYDVWLGNIRGNTYSRAHVNLSPKEYPFWNFTFNEMALHDLPAMIDYILEETGHTQLYYIGHSMGTTMFWVLCSSRPEYNSKIKDMFSLAPIAYMSNAETPLRILAPYAKDLEAINKWLGHGEFMAHDSYFTKMLKLACLLSSKKPTLCENILFTLCGYDSEEFEMKLLPVIFGHTPAGASSKTLTHYSQLIESAEFRKFDYGPEGNMLEYNSAVPPSYNLSKITAPVSLYYSSNDLLANVKDVKQLAESLPNLVVAHHVEYPMFNHIDFLWSKNINSLLNDYILERIEGGQTGAHHTMPEPNDENISKEYNIFNNIFSGLKLKPFWKESETRDNVIHKKTISDQEHEQLKTKLMPERNSRNSYMNRFADNQYE